MASEKQKEVKVSTELQQFPRMVVYNRCGVERLGHMRIFHFALVDGDHVRDSYACAIDEDAIQRQKEDLLDFVARAGKETPVDFVPWRPETRTAYSVDLANVIKGARMGSICELRLYNFAIGDVIDAPRQEKTTIDAIPVALLRCEESLQRALFLSLYEPDRPAKNVKTR